jgi:hypothetical protein
VIGARVHLSNIVPFHECEARVYLALKSVPAAIGDLNKPSVRYRCFPALSFLTDAVEIVPIYKCN